MQAEGRAALTAERPAVTTAALYRLMAVAAVAWLLVDQATKIWALSALSPGDPRPILGSVLQLNLIRNAGAAFSLGDGATWVLTVLAVAVCGWVLSVARRLGSRAWALALGSLLGGALGNLVDRFVREPGPGRGHVVDFIDYNGWFIGNVADIAIVGAAAVIAWLAVKGIPIEGAGAAGDSALDSALDSAGDNAGDSDAPNETDQPNETTDANEGNGANEANGASEDLQPRDEPEAGRG